MACSIQFNGYLGGFLSGIEKLIKILLLFGGPTPSRWTRSRHFLALQPRSRQAAVFRNQSRRASDKMRDDRIPVSSVRRSLVHLLGGAATYMVLGTDLSAMWETFHGDNRKKTATNAVAPITASTLVPSPRSGLKLHSSCIISPNAPDVQQAAPGKRSSGTSAIYRKRGEADPRQNPSIGGFAVRASRPQILRGLANRWISPSNLDFGAIIAPAQFCYTGRSDIE